MPLALITHCAKAEQRAAALGRMLRGHGIDVWLDRERVGTRGADAAERMGRALAACDVVVALVPEAAEDAPWCRPEYGPLLSEAAGATRVVVIEVRDDGHASAGQSLPGRYKLSLRPGPLTHDGVSSVADWARELGVEAAWLRASRSAAYSTSLFFQVAGAIPDDFPAAWLAAECFLGERGLPDLHRGLGEVIGGLRGAAEEIGVVFRESETGDVVHLSARCASQARLTEANRLIMAALDRARRATADLEPVLLPGGALRRTMRVVSRVGVTVARLDADLALGLGMPEALALTDQPPWWCVPKRGLSVLAGCHIIDDLPMVLVGRKEDAMALECDALVSRLSAYEVELRRAAQTYRRQSLPPP